MKRKHKEMCLVGGLLLLAVALPTWAGPPRGQDDDWRDKDSHYRERPHGDRDRLRGQGLRQSPDRNGADRRPLGTQYFAPRSYGGRDRYDRYDREAGRAANAVRRDERGRVLLSEPMDDRGYRVRVLTPDGYVRERYVDPRRDDLDRHRDD